MDGKRSSAGRGSSSNPDAQSAAADDREGRETDSPYQILVEQTVAQLGRFDGASWQVTPFTYRNDFESYLSKNGRFTIRSWAWCVSHADQPRCDVRMVFISGAKNSILNTWVFPYDPTQVPVFAAELIAIGGQPRLTFMDIQVPAMPAQHHGRVASVAAQVRCKHPSLRIDEQPPHWAVEATAGEYLFARQLPVDQFETIRDAYRGLLSGYVDFVASSCSNADPNPKGSDAIAELHAYQIHHMRHSPGKLFLGKVFGAGWTESFLNEFLFCAPGEVA